MISTVRFILKVRFIFTMSRSEFCFTAFTIFANKFTTSINIIFKSIESFFSSFTKLDIIVFSIKTLNIRRRRNRNSFKRRSRFLKTRTKCHRMKISILKRIWMMRKWSNRKQWNTFLLFKNYFIESFSMNRTRWNLRKRKSIWQFSNSTSLFVFFSMSCSWLINSSIFMTR